MPEGLPLAVGGPRPGSAAPPVVAAAALPAKQASRATIATAMPILPTTPDRTNPLLLEPLALSFDRLRS